MEYLLVRLIAVGLSDMTVGLVVEDRYPGAIEEMCRKMGINTKIRKHRKRINVRKASAYAKDLYNDGRKTRA